MTHEERWTRHDRQLYEARQRARRRELWWLEWRGLIFAGALILLGIGFMAYMIFLLEG